MSVDFFSWIRDGVRRAVLTGVSDAVQHLGESPTGDFNQRLHAALSAGNPALDDARGTSTGRKRLGRSLKDFQDE